MTVLGFSIPLWALALVVIVALIIGWKLIKFALTLLAAFVLVLLGVMILDFFNVFTLLKELLTGL
ncbi:MAG TPA: hypothetical protein ENI45_02345 [Thermoplasmatales archaeon]|nr:hypothetical protein [Thermoplasmatales archaeon]